MENKIKNQQAFSVKLYEMGIEISGTNSAGAVWDKNGEDISGQELIQALIKEHNAEQPDETDPFLIKG